MTNIPDPIMKAWQQKLLDAGYALPIYGADGLGGTETQTAILSFQEANGLPTTGQFDEATRLKLNPPTLKVNPMGSILLSFLNSSVALGIIRNILMAAGAVIVTKGWADQNTVTEIVGGAISAISAILSAISNNNKATDKAIVKAVEAHPAITVVPATETATGKPIVAVNNTAVGSNMRAAS